jgi:hypothetical protein
LSGSGATTYTWNNNVQDGVAFTPANTQTYTVSGTDANGCTNTAQVSVTVNLQSSSTLVENACDEFILNGQVYTQSGTFIQVIQNANGCDSTISLQLTLNYSPNQPLVSLASDTILTVNPQQSAIYQWIDCVAGVPIPNETSVTYSASLNGQYAVIVSNSCGSDTSDCVTINTIGLIDLPLSSLLIYPNPTNSIVYVTGLSEDITYYEVLDMQGRILKKAFLSKHLNEIDLINLPRGLYWIRAEGYNLMEVVKQ